MKTTNLKTISYEVKTRNGRKFLENQNKKKLYVIKYRLVVLVLQKYHQQGKKLAKFLLFSSLVLESFVVAIFCACSFLLSCV